MFELSQKFYFEAEHTLNRLIDTENCKRIHGHTYLAEVKIAGQSDPSTGLVVDLGEVRKEIDAVRELLDHRFLDEISDLGEPTLENLYALVATTLSVTLRHISKVRIWRECSSDSYSILV